MRVSSLRWPLIASIASFLLASTVEGQRTYTDSKGDVFTIADDAPPPRIVINANGALSLFHLGLPSSQLAAVYDHWVIRGSTLNLGDTSGAYISEFAIDPNAEEIAFLEGAENLTPGCTETSAGCALNFNAEDLAGLEYDFVVVIRAGLSALDSKQTDLGENIIWIDDKYEHNTGCYGTEGEEIALITNETNCYSMSLIDVVREIEEFADFLGIEPTEEVRRAKQTMCESAANFVEHSQTLRDNGIYAAAITMRPFNGITMTWLPPIGNEWLKTLEELGFPLVHPPNSTQPADFYQTTLADWFVNCDTWPNCEDTTGAMSIDLWLLDSRTYAGIQDDAEGTKTQFPDPAFVADQYTYWQFNDGAISYTNIARYLDDVVAATSNIQRVHIDTIRCVGDIDVTSSEYGNRVNGGLNVPGSGTFACRGNLQSLYTECPFRVSTPVEIPVEYPVANPANPGSEPLFPAGTFPNQTLGTLVNSITSGGFHPAGAFTTQVLVLTIVLAWLYV